MKLKSMNMKRLMESIAWRLFPCAQMSLKQPNGVVLSLQDRADIKILQEIFVERGYMAFVDKMGPISTWIDIGANCGMFSLYVEEYAREHKWSNARKAILVEPNKYALRTLRLSLKLSQLEEQYQVIDAAIGGRDSSIPFYESKMTYKSSIYALKSKEKSRQVPCANLDNLIDKMGGQVDLIKMDIEGGEKMVLENWLPSFARARYALIEWHEPAASFAWVEEKLLSIGYRRVLVLPPSYLKDDPAPAHTLPIGTGLWARG